MEGNLTNKTASEIFHELFPEYLAMGMSYREFWELDSSLVKAYRKAHRIRNDEINYTAWLNGIYILNALNSGIPVYLTGIAKTRVDLPKYPEKPIDFEERNREEKAKKDREMQIARMREMAEQFNATFRKRQSKKE